MIKFYFQKYYNYCKPLEESILRNIYLSFFLKKKKNLLSFQLQKLSQMSENVYTTVLILRD